MRILFTGASSFTGLWFVRALAEAGHEVVATLRRRPEEYPEELRRRRVMLAAQQCRTVAGVKFGEEAFLRLIADEGPWDMLCHHAAEVTDHRSPGFDVQAALQNNTLGLPAVLETLYAGGCRRIALTGSVFEQDEGAGSEGRPAFSPYGLSKGLTAQVFRFYTARQRMHLGKFVIPNPFGPYEEPRFTAYLMKCWRADERATVRTPAYVRDNIHISLLAAAYAAFVGELPATPGESRLGPSGYVESQGAFAERVAGEMRARLNWACALELGRQTEFSEPRVRLNTDAVDGAALGWDERRAWDQFAEYYSCT
jgi:nucleoside-diphosphate-sugar epimerase